jgi:hypothetical protein
MTFQRMMDCIFANIPFTFIYLDNILVASRTAEEHQQHLRAVLGLLQENFLQSVIYHRSIVSVITYFYTHPSPGILLAVVTSNIAFYWGASVCTIRHNVLYTHTIPYIIYNMCRVLCCVVLPVSVCGGGGVGLGAWHGGWG